MEAGCCPDLELRGGQSCLRVCSPGLPSESGLAGRTLQFLEQREWRREARAQPCFWKEKLRGPEVPEMD